MQAIKNEHGQIIYYIDWQKKRTPAKEVFNNIMAIQADGLKHWSERLNATVYIALLEAVLKSNKGLTPETHNAYDCIKRGQSLDTFIDNWRPGKPINEIYW